MVLKNKNVLHFSSKSFSRTLQLRQQSYIACQSFKMKPQLNSILTTKLFLKTRESDKFLAHFTGDKKYVLFLKVSIAGPSQIPTFLNSFDGLDASISILDNSKYLYKLVNLPDSLKWIASLVSVGVVYTITTTSFLAYRAVIQRCISIESNNSLGLYISILFTREQKVFVPFVDKHNQIINSVRDLYFGDKTRESILLEISGMLSVPATNIISCPARLIPSVKSLCFF